jgi:Lipocalin-like domain
MKTINLTSTLTFVLISSFFFSCQKETTEEITCSVNTQNLSGKYTLSSVKYKETSTSPEMDIREIQEECEKDDLLILNPDGTYTTEDAGISCNTNEIDSGSWSLTGNELNSDGILKGTISKFDCKNLEYFVKNVYKDGDIVEFKLLKQ